MILWGRAARILLVSFLEFPRVERSWQQDNIQSAHRRLLKDEVLKYCLVVSIKRPVRWVFASKNLHMVKRSIIIADFQAGFSNGAFWPESSSVLPHQRGNHFKGVAMLQDAHRGLVAITMSPTRTDDSKTNPSHHAAVEWVPFSQPNKDIDFGGTYLSRLIGS